VKAVEREREEGKCRREEEEGETVSDGTAEQERGERTHLVRRHAVYMVASTKMTWKYE